MKDKMIYLYIKQSPLGLKYLGVTIREDPYKYMGSGTVWKRHLKKYNFKDVDISTDILFESSNKNIIKLWGLYYSKLYNIVESNEWANLIPESGEFSTLGMKMSKEAREKLSNTMKINFSNGTRIHPRKNKKLSQEIKDKIGKFAKGRIPTKEDKIKQSLGQIKKVYQFSLNNEFIKEWESVLLAKTTLKINNISNCCNNRQKTAGKFKWSYTKNKYDRQ